MLNLKPHRRVALVAASLAMATAVTGCAGSGSSSGGGDASFRRPVDMIVPFGPGGGADQVARAVGKAMEGSIDTQIPAINVPGATGSTGMTKMISGRPGEAMAILIQDTLATVPAGSASFRLDEIRAVCRVQSMPSALMVRKGTFENFKELAAAAKAKPGELKVATVGANSVDDIVLASMGEKLGTKFRAVPFSQPSERYAALLGGGVDVLYEQLGDVKQYLDSGDFVPVVLVADEPVEGYEDVPDTGKLGLPPEVVLPQFRGIVVSSETSDEIVDALSSACGDATKSSAMGKFQKDVFASEDSYQDPAAFQKFIEQQEKLISSQLKAYGIGG